MKHQSVNVDYWAMGKAMLMYGAITVLCWIMLRLFHTVFSFPRRMRQQQQSIQDTLAELQRRYPDLNITEEDLKNAEQDLEQWMKEEEEKDKQKQLTKEQDGKKKVNSEEEPSTSQEPKSTEDKKTL